MGIEALYPESERYGHFNKHGLEEKMIKNDIIAHADIQNYANYIVSRLKKIKSTDKDSQKSFVLDALNGGRLFANFFYSLGVDNFQEVDVKDKKALRGAFLRIRQALVEELKGKVDSKVYLVVEDIVKDLEKSDGSTGDLYLADPTVEDIKIPVQSSARKRNVISVIKDIDNGVESVYKDQQWVVPKNQESAFMLYAQMVPHPNLTKIKEYDQENNTVIYEKRNIETLLDYCRNHGVDFFIKTKEFVDILKVLNDCVEAALYLENNRLVLQDIKLSNIGIENDGKEIRGVLFDLEGLVEDGTPKEGRLHAVGYFPPEAAPAAFQAESAVATGTQTTISESDNVTKISSKEMTFQLGVCLQKIINAALPVNVYEMLKLSRSLEARFKLAIVEDIKDLALEMQEVSPAWRVNLRNVHAKLAGVIKDLKNLQSKSGKYV